MSLGDNGTSKLARGWLAALAGAIAIALTFGALIGFGADAANAATKGITTTVTVDGEAYNGTPVVSEGAVVNMKIQYDVTVLPGSTVKVALGTNITLKELTGGNEAVKSAIVDPSDPNAVLITFVEEWPADINQGYLDFSFTVNSVEKSSTEKISWTVDGAEQSLDVIIKNGGDEFANVSDWVNKAASPGNLNGHVSVKDGKVVVADGIIGAEISYQLDVNTAAAKTGYTVADQLPAGMKYVEGSFSASQTTWDANGLNKQTNNELGFVPTIDEAAFSGTLDLPAASKTTLKYKATVADEAARIALENKIQTEYDKVAQAGGNYFTTLVNTATFGGDTTKTAAVNVGGNVAGPVGPGLGKAFGKTAAWPNTMLEPAEDGTVDPAADVTYTLKSDLREWNKSNKLTTLTGNMVVWDKLPTQMKWNTADAAFISATSDADSKVDFPLTKAASFMGDHVAFQADEYVGKYFVDEASQTLYVNVGQDSSMVVNVAMKAQLTTVDGLSVTTSTTVPGQKDYKVTNRGQWSWADTKQQTNGYNRESSLTSKFEDENGFNMPNKFAKASGSNVVVVKPGEGGTVDYKFTVGEGAGVDLRKSSIVDYVDTNIFDVSNLATIAVSGKYDWWREMGASSFLLEMNADGNLLITLSENGVAQVAEWGTNKRFELTLSLPLKPVVGKQTLQIKNKATLFGEDDKALFWSESQSEATSFGQEAEVAKSIRDTRNQIWSQNLRAEVDGDGNLVQSKFVYRIQLIPHGGFNGVSILDVVDNLPSGLKFEGFVTDDNKDTGINPTMSVQNLTGNLQARFDADPESELGGTVTMFQKAGTVLNASGMTQSNYPTVFVLVSIADFAVDEAIVNKIGGSSTTITPSDGYPLSIAKVDSLDAEKVISDPNARFQILDADNNVVVENVFVHDGALRVKDEEGVVKNVKVSEVGTYTVKEITAPAGYDLSVATITVVVEDNGSSKAEKFFNTPSTYAVGDFVWVDADKNGLQDDGEVLEGVKVTLLDGTGKTIATTETNAAGLYIFDDLPAGEYQVKFELTAEQSVRYNFTAPNAPAASKDTNDSDADPVTGLTAKFTLDDTNTALTKDYGFDVLATKGIDPTWDAGVIIKPSVSVGDVVWVDSNRDGIQTKDEPGIKGVVLTIVGPDGKSVTDVFGKTVRPVTTDDNGAYNFVNLPVLKDGESYTVTIDQVASKTPLAPYIPTITDSGDRATDSSTWTAKSEGLTVDGEQDLTLDFGFVLPKVSVGDYLWVDSNRDGIQGDPKDEPGIKGVVLTITGPDGKSVTDVFGKTVRPVTTDDNGAYNFVNLPVLKDGESYTVTIDQVASKTPLAPYVPTVPGAGEDRGADSSTGSAISTGLTQHEDHDPTLDFGFVLPKASVGDYVWVDSNRDGIQGDPKDEPGIKGVVLTITGPDGKSVTDVFGKTVRPVTTDDNGAYNFVNLPVLKDGESYTVTIDQVASKTPLAPYVPTVPGAGEDRGADSSTGSAISTGLTQHEDHDPTLDFGFVLIPDAPAPTTPAPTTSPPATGDLSNTGFDGAVLMAMGLLLTMLGGGAVVLTGRRRRASSVRH